MELFIDSKGYFRFRNSGKLFHRWVMEKKIGRSLVPGEVVHHIDRNKLNNSWSNLYLCKDQDHHEAIHMIDAARFGWFVSLNGFRKSVNLTY